MIKAFRKSRTLAVGAAIMGMSVAYRFGVLPLAQRMAEYRSLIVDEQTMFAQELALAANASTDTLEVARRARDFKNVAARFFLGESDPNVALSEVQAYLDEVATRSRLSVQNMTAATPDTLVPGVLLVTIDLKGRTDLQGALEFARTLQTGERLLSITQFDIQRPAATASSGPSPYEMLELTVGATALILMQSAEKR